jgi:hypothetical protein
MGVACFERINKEKLVCDQNLINKGKGHPITGHQGPRGGGYLFINSQTNLKINRNIDKNYQN